MTTRAIAQRRTGARRWQGFLALAALLAVALWAALCGGDARGRVIVLGIDGLDPDTVDLLMSEGALPSFARLRRGGAYGRLRGSPPLLSPVLWTTIATGRPPHEHGISHFTAVDPRSGESLPVTSGMRRVNALWNVASEAGRRVGLVGWWASWPAEAVDGVVVSDHLSYHFLFPQAESGSMADAGLTHPPELAEQIAPLVRRPADVTLAEASRFLSVSAEQLSRPFDFQDDVSHFRWALAAADTNRRIGLHVWEAERPELLMVYVEAVDSTSHLFGHLFRASGLRGELAAQQSRFGDAVEQMYVYADGVVGEYLQAMDERTTLVVCSDHGFRLGVPRDDPSRTRNMQRRASERFHADEGVLYLYGRGVEPRARLDRPALLDVAPTLLALLGLPAARDMPGRVLVEGLAAPAPAPRVASYETGGRRAEAQPADAVAPQIEERLRSLGYLSGATRSGGETPSLAARRNEAALLFQARRLDESAALYEALVSASPEDAGLRTSLAGVLGELGRYDDALRQLERAVELDPLNAEAYHNRAVITERRGDRERAVALYRTAVRYAPRYEPSRRALLRLTGSPLADPPSDETQRSALGLAERAADAARRGDYPAAMSLLDDAERIAPRYVVIHQYRSNVAYLMGEIPAAIRSLERALEIQPDNALLRANLERLGDRAESAGR